MTPFQEELAKVALDKGLLLLIASGFGYYLGRLADRYRANHAYYLALAQKRIDAYQALGEHLGNQVAKLAKLLFVLEQERAEPSSDAADFSKQLDAAYKELVRSHEETKGPLLKHSIFLTKEAGDALNSCQAKIGEVLEAFQEAPRSGITPDQLFALGRQANERLARLFERMANEIHSHEFR
jgi:enoyl-CoA hydratase/carnithine racemase